MTTAPEKQGRATSPEEFHRLMEASHLASEVRERDIDVSDDYRVEQCLREHHPKISKRMIAEVIVVAREQRRDEQMKTLFELIEDKVDGWADVDLDLIDWIADELDDVDPRPADREAARYAARLLIEQARQRKRRAEEEAWRADEEAEEAR